MTDPLVVEDVELRLLERRRALVLHHLDARAVADNVRSVLDSADAADVQAERRVELERPPTAGGFRVPEHHPDLFADLVREEHRGLRTVHRPCELP